ncbi:glycerophosphoryl diester phosphodiesterase membrane domain-containing protein [Microbacterium sp. SLBN-146]|uniref:glycerophosphoryl diester phosphodiesterase membrane domain-containing protein n=1 Tax=Microbacterium sp. SLBN-146 TaxID=2768457 RepID=UPI001173A0FC|nr:glycerophosphoryl diester phosphodiesterase membrane domain-containing protein [Microbacterium sp. SLBN-146]TQJ32699.1 membrane-anchored glycerophosphoryl diester phosphodiesterase (GDPDase) [Microbacterium sp. SLBN-146]
MTAYPSWTPASRPGIVPLHPLSFGTILGRSFVALRQNPKVLLGFALVVQTLAYIAVLVLIGLASFATFSRLDTLRPGTEEFETVLAGSIALLVIVSFVLSLAAGAVSVVVQAVVVVEVTHAVVAEKLTLGAIWRQVKPSAWRLIGYSALLMLVIGAGLAILVTAVLALAAAAAPAAIVLTIFGILGAIPLVWWLTIKLLLVPSAIIIERATIRGALARSWRLTRGRFWPALGVIILISLTFSVLGQIVSIPFSFLSLGVSTIIAPTGDVDTEAIIGFLISTIATYAVLLVIQSVALVVQSTATGLIYVDARMRKEGLDLDLLEYVEKRDAGMSDLPDPYLVHIGRDLSARFAPVAYAQPGYPQGYPPQAPQGYPQAPPQAPQGYSPQAPQGYPPAPPQAPQASPPQASPPQTYPTAPPAAPAAPPASTAWQAPGASDSEPPRP